MAGSNYLTKPEVVEFLTGKLHVPLTADQLTIQSVENLTKICQAYTAKMPVSSVRFLMTPIEDRRLPTAEEVKTVMMELSGGTCYENTVFMHWILVALGYEVHFLLSNAFGPVDNHSFVKVTLPDGKRYIVDVGAVYYMSENLISLDFVGDKSPVYRESLWDIRLKRTTIGEENKLAVQIHVNENTTVPWLTDIDEDGFATTHTFSLKERSADDLAAIRLVCYRDAEVCPVFIRIYVYRFPNGRLREVTDTIYVEENEKRERVIVKTKSREEFMRLVLEHFGDFLDESAVSKAIDKQIVYLGYPKRWKEESAEVDAIETATELIDPSF